jgi:hypothetical protein
MRLRQLSLFASAILTCALLGALLAAPAFALPERFFGMTAHESMNDSEPDWSALQHAGVQKFRMQIKWQTINEAGGGGEFGWKNEWAWQNTYDRYFEKAAKHGIAILPYIYTRKGGNTQYYWPGEPAFPEWKEFVWTVVQRYGQAGSFWFKHPSIPQLTVEYWEVWNEPNLPMNCPAESCNGKEYGEFLVATATTIREAQSKISGYPAKVLSGGLYQERWNYPVASYIAALGKAPGIGAAYDGLSLHPYALGKQSEGARTTAEKAGAVQSNIYEAYSAQSTAIGAKPIWVTEVGWPVDGTEMQHVTPADQAVLLTETYNWIKNNWSTYNIKFAAWYLYKDVSSDPATRWDLHAGLRDVNGGYRPSWYAYETQTGAPVWPDKSVSELGFAGFNGSGNTSFDGYVGAPGYQGHSMWGETGYPKITDPQNIDTVAIDSDANGLDELGFVRFNGSGNTHIDTYTGGGYKALSSTCDTGYPKITDPQNVQTVAIDSNGDGADELGFVRFNGSGNTHIDAYSGSCFQTLSGYCDTGYPKITDPQNVQAIAIDTNGDGVDELAFVRFNGSGNTHIDAYSGPCFQTLSTFCDTGYPKITDPQNVRALAIDTNGDGVDELGFLRYNAASGKAHLDTYSGSCFKSLASSSDTAYPAVAKPENVEALAINWTDDPNPGAWYVDNQGGNINSDPDIASWGSNRLDIFAKGAADNGLWHRAWSNGWFPWERIGTEVLSSGPSAVSWGNGRLDMVARNATGIRHWWFENPGSWNLAENFTGTFTSDPDIASWGPNRLDIFVKGSDNRLWHKAWSNGWFEWEQIGAATLASGPGAVSWGSGRIDIVARASDNTVMHWWFDNSTGVWSGPENLGGNITSDPDISSREPGRLDVFGKGADGTLQHKYYSKNGGWSNWESLGGSPASGPGAVSWGANRIDVVARAANNTVEHWYWMDP